MSESLLSAAASKALMFTQWCRPGLARAGNYQAQTPYRRHQFGSVATQAGQHPGGLADPAAGI